MGRYGSGSSTMVPLTVVDSNRPNAALSTCVCRLVSSGAPIGRPTGCLTTKALGMLISLAR